MFTAIIVDDEINAREFLEKLIIRHLSNKIIVVEKVDTIEKSIEAIRKYKPNIVFLDIQLKDESGFDLFKLIKNIEFNTIFTTAYKEYSIKAIKHSAFDYLVKPINIADLFLSIKRLESKKESLNQEKVKFILENLSSESDKYNKLAIPSEKGLELEKISGIIYCQAQSNYSKIITIDNREILTSKTLKYLEEKLPKEVFFRTHKSYLVNLNYIKSYSKHDNNITCVNNVQIPVSNRQKTNLINVLIKKD